MPNKNTTLLVFDIDGTLCNTTTVDDSCFEQALNHFYPPAMDKFDWNDFQHVTDHGLVLEYAKRKLGHSIPKEEAEKVLHYFYGLLQKTSEYNTDLFAEVPGTSAFLRTLQSDNWHFSLATGASFESAQIKLGQLDFDFKQVPIASSTDAISREIITQTSIQRAKAHYNKDKYDQVIYFGDGEWDYKTTKALNIPLIGVDVQQNGKLVSLGVPLVIQNYLNHTIVLDYIYRIIENN